MTTINMTEVQALQLRIRNLESMLNRTTDFLDEVISRGNLYNIGSYMEDAEEIVGESRATLEGEFEE